MSPSATNLPVPAVLNWRGIDGVPAVEPLTARPPLAAGGKEALQLPLRHAGTFLCDLRLLGDGQAQPSQARALIVRESEAVAVDRDEVLLIEDWRVRPDGTAIAPGADPGNAVPVHTINGQTSLDLSARTNERVRLRIISGCQRSVIAIKLEGARGPRDGHRQPAVRAVPGPQRRAGAGAGRPGRRLHRCDDAGGYRNPDPPARRQGSPPDRQDSSSPANRRSARPRCRRPRRCPPTASPSGSTSRTPPGSIWPSADHRATG